MNDQFNPLFPPLERLDYARFLASQVSHLINYKTIVNVTKSNDANGLQFILSDFIRDLEKVLAEEINELSPDIEWENEMIKSIKRAITQDVEHVVEKSGQ